MADILKAMVAADVIVLATPVYFYTIKQAYGLGRNV